MAAASRQRGSKGTAKDPIASAAHTKVSLVGQKTNPFDPNDPRVADDTVRQQFEDFRRDRDIEANRRLAATRTAGPGDPDLPDAAPDAALPFFRELARLRTQRGIRRGGSNRGGFLSLDRNRPDPSRPLGQGRTTG